MAKQSDPRDCAGIKTLGIDKHPSTRGNFRKNKAKKDGLSPVCKDCDRVYAQAKKDGKTGQRAALIAQRKADAAKAPAKAAPKRRTTKAKAPAKDPNPTRKAGHTKPAPEPQAVKRSKPVNSSVKAEAQVAVTA